MKHLSDVHVNRVARELANLPLSILQSVVIFARLYVVATFDYCAVGAGDADEISRPCLIKQLRVITSGPIPPDPVELLSGKRMQDLLSVSQNEFDYIIIDGPPVIGLADALVLSNLADATILTVQAGSTKKASLQSTLKRLERTSGNIIGTLLTRVDRASNPEYNEDSYYTYTSPKQS